MILLEPVESNLASYIVLLIFAYIFFIAPYSRSASTDVTERTQSKDEKHLALHFMRTTRELFSAISVYAVGALMEISKKSFILDPRNFLYVFYGNAIIALAFHIARRVRERVEKDMEEESAAEGSN